MLGMLTPHAGNSAADARKPAPSAVKERASAPARTACEADRKWVVEHHLDSHDIVLGDTNPRQTVYIFGCRNCTIQARLGQQGVALALCKAKGQKAHSVLCNHRGAESVSWLTGFASPSQLSENSGPCSDVMLFH